MEKVNNSIATNPSKLATNTSAQITTGNQVHNSLFASNDIYVSEMFNPELTDTLFSYLETSIANARANAIFMPNFEMFGPNPWMGSTLNPFMLDMMSDFGTTMPPSKSTFVNAKETTQNEKTKLNPPPKESVADGTATTQKQQLFKQSTQRKSNHDEIIDRIAKEEGVDPKLIKAMMHQESGGDHKAVSYKGAGGLMQLMPGTAKAMGVKDRFDPEQNIRGGARYIAQQLKKHNGDVKLALASYNAGPGAVQKYGGIPPYKETQNYVASIMAKYQS